MSEVNRLGGKRKAGLGLHQSRCTRCAAIRAGWKMRIRLKEALMFAQYMSRGSVEVCWVCHCVETEETKRVTQRTLGARHTVQWARTEMSAPCRCQVYCVRMRVIPCHQQVNAKCVQRDAETQARRGDAGFAQACPTLGCTVATASVSACVDADAGRCAE